MREIILIDFFDTVMFREVHSFQLPSQWAKIISEKYGLNQDLLGIRKKLENEFKDSIYEIPYKELIKNIFDMLDMDCSFDEFYKFCFDTEVNIDLSTQYPNSYIIRRLKKAKDAGKKIYIVSDYPLPRKAYDIYLSYFGLSELFDGVFCSEDYHASKYRGPLYHVVLDELKIKAENAVMIGESKKSDYINAQKYGLNTILYRPIFHKIKINFRYRVQYDYRKDVIKHVFNLESQKNMFGEYCVNFWFFEKELYANLKNKGQEPCFLARGGYLLQLLFNTYEYYRPKVDTISSKYLRISRKVIIDAKNSKDGYQLLSDYFMQEGINVSKLVLVDEGWNCSSQFNLSKIFDCKTEGYYIGCFRKSDNDSVKLNGLLFEGDGNYKDIFEGIFRSDLTFYEQICTCSDGSIKCYERVDGTIKPVEDKVDIEINLYNKYTKSIQKRIIQCFQFLCVWNPEISKNELAHYVLKCGLNGDKRRLKILKEFDENYFENLAHGMNESSNKKAKAISNLKIKDLITNPCNYFRYICKVRLLSQSNPMIRLFYPVFKPLIQLYISLFVRTVR